jgi:hypothetical protein
MQNYKKKFGLKRDSNLFSISNHKIAIVKYSKTKMKSTITLLNLITLGLTNTDDINLSLRKSKYLSNIT